MSELTQALAGAGVDDPRHMALIDEPKIDRHAGEILVPLGQAFKGGRDANAIAEL
jgi:hypothetical protein